MCVGSLGNCAGYVGGCPGNGTRKTTARGGRDRGNYIRVKRPCPLAMMYAYNVLSLVPPNLWYVLYRDHAISETMTETMVYLWNSKENADDGKTRLAPEDTQAVREVADKAYMKTLHAENPLPRVLNWMLSPLPRCHPAPRQWDR